MGESDVFEVMGCVMRTSSRATDEDDPGSEAAWVQWASEQTAANHSQIHMRKSMCNMLHETVTDTTMALPK